MRGMYRESCKCRDSKVLGSFLLRHVTHLWKQAHMAYMRSCASEHVTQPPQRKVMSTQAQHHLCFSVLMCTINVHLRPVLLTHLQPFHPHGEWQPYWIEYKAAGEFFDWLNACPSGPHVVLSQSTFYTQTVKQNVYLAICLLHWVSIVVCKVVYVTLALYLLYSMLPSRYWR